MALAQRLWNEIRGGVEHLWSYVVTLPNCTELCGSPKGKGDALGCFLPQKYLVYVIGLPQSRNCGEVGMRRSSKVVSRRGVNGVTAAGYVGPSFSPVLM